jgi:hypothetical protein
MWWGGHANGAQAPSETASRSPAPSTGLSAKGEPVPAPLVQWAIADGGNGHYFQAVAAPGGIKWEDAQIWAIEHGGYLATIGSAAENNHVFHLIDEPQFWRAVVTPTGRAGQSGPWLGGFRPVNAPAAKGWQWFNTDEAFAFTHWAGRQPGNENGNEDRLQFFSWEPAARASAWNDQSGDALERGFVVEYVSAALAPTGVGKTPSPPPRSPPVLEPDLIAQWTADGGNSHFYQVIAAPNGVRWADAHAWALAHGGYLATIGSAAENEFVFKLADNVRFWADDPQGNSHGPLLGGRQPPGSGKPDTGWEWDVYEGPFTYTRWAAGQPGNHADDGGMDFFASGSKRRQPTWGVVNARQHLARSFVVEYVSAARAPAGNPRALPAVSPLQPAAIYHWAVVDGGNGHYYQAVSARSGITWDAAQALALANGGYLATIGSAAENNFVFQLIDDRRFWNNGEGYSVGPYIGGFKSPGSPRPEEGWQWVHGDGTFAYTNWAPGKPNNANGNEDRAHYYAPARTNAQEPFWNDQPASADEWGFVVEFDTKPTP